MKHSHRLEKSEINTIIKSVLILGEPKTRVARAHGIDHSTVIYYCNKFDGKSRSEIISAIIPVCEKCSCTAFKCQSCGKYLDNIKSDEYQEIFRLKQKVIELERELTYEKKKSKGENTFGDSLITSCEPIIGLIG